MNKLRHTTALYFFAVCAIALGLLVLLPGCRPNVLPDPVAPIPAATAVQQITDAPTAPTASETPAVSPAVTADADTPVPTEEITAAPEVTPTPAPTAAPTPSPAPTPTPVPTPTPKPVTSPRIAYYSNHGIIRVDNAAYELGGYSHSAASSYAALVSKVADDLAGQTRVYSLLIPTSYGITFPDDVKPQLPEYPDMRANMEDLFSMMNSNVVRVRCFDNLYQHRNEYIYFRTDHHWNGTGAYYAYETFCNSKGIHPYTMSQRREVRFENFLGSFYTASGEDPALLPADTVIAFYPVSSSASMIMYDENGNGTNWPIIQNVNSYRPSGKYNCFAGSDHPLTVFTNPAVTDGSVLIIIKESFGNALLPLLVDHYQTIYEIDYRYWSGNLQQYAREVGATDLVFANNIVSASARTFVGKLARIIGQ